MQRHCPVCDHDFALFSILDALINTSLALTLAPDDETPIMLLTASPKFLDDTVIIKVEDPPLLVDIPFDDAKVEGALPLVVPPTDAHPIVEPILVYIDHQEKFTTKVKFATHSDLLSGFGGKQGG